MITIQITHTQWESKVNCSTSYVYFLAINNTNGSFLFYSILFYFILFYFLVQQRTVILSSPTIK